MNFSVNTEKNHNLTKAINYGGWIVLILSPVLLLLIQSVIYGRNLFMGVPVWSDELDYWREMYSFSHNGFNFGGSMYVGMDAQFGPMGAHSVSPIVAWGIFGWLFKTGVASHAILWANILGLSLAWIIFTVLVKPDLRKTISAIIIAFLFPMTILYVHSSMIELMCMGGIIVYFSLFYRWEKEEKNIWFVLLMLVGIWCVCLRITYVVILFPAIWKKNKFGFNFKTIICMLAYLISFGVFYKLYNLFCAGYPGWTTEKISNANGIVGKLGVVFYNTKGNIARLLSPFSGDRAQAGMRYFYLLLILILVVAAFVKKVNPELTDNRKVDFMNLSLFIMMGGLLVMMVCLYDIKDWRDFRTFAPVAFGVFLYLLLKTEKQNNIMQIMLWCSFTMCFLMYLSSGIDFVKEKGEAEIRDLSACFESLETEDIGGKPRTLGICKELNWCDISVMESIPSRLGVQVFYDEITVDIIGKTDYVLISKEVYELNSDLYEKYLVVSEVPDYGVILKIFD